MAAALKFVNLHNSVLSIDVQDPATAYYHQILHFLLRSRIHHLVTHNPVVVASYVRDFWKSAHYDSTVTPAVIRATVNGQALAFSLVDLRRILQLGDAAQDNEHVEFPLAMRVGAFVRMGYSGNAARPIIKTGLYGQWRFLAHVVLRCLSAKKAGFDQMNAREQSLMIALVYNKPYSFSIYFFEAFRTLVEENGRDKFLLFPRFVMMIIRDRLPRIPIVGGTLSVASIGGRIFADCRSNKTGRPTAELETPLFGHLVNEDYVAPPEDGWIDDYPLHTRTARRKRLKRTDGASTSTTVDVAEAHGVEPMDNTPVPEAPVTEEVEVPDVESVEPVVEAVVPEVESEVPSDAYALGRPFRFSAYTARAARADTKGKSKAAGEGPSGAKVSESSSGAGRTVEERLDILAHDVNYMYRLIEDGSVIVKDINDRTRRLEDTVTRLNNELACGNTLLLRLSAQNRRLEDLIKLQQYKITRDDLRLDEADKRFSDLTRMNEHLEQRVVKAERLLRDHLVLQAAQVECSCKGHVAGMSKTINV